MIAGSFGAGMVNSVGVGVGRGVGMGERQNGFFKSTRGRGAGILFSALGRRVRLVHLEGLNVLAGEGQLETRVGKRTNTVRFTSALIRGATQNLAYCRQCSSFCQVRSF